MDPNLENTVVYRAKVTPQLPVSVIDANDIVQIIGNWVQSAPSITVNRLILNIDPNCPITLESFDAEDCSVITTISSSVQLPLPTVPPSSVDDNSKSSESTGVIVGATIAAIVVVILAVVIIVLTILHCRLKSNYR